MPTEPVDTLAGQIEKQYKDGLSYMRAMGFLEKWPEHERFKAGDQWPPPTPRTKGLPRPVFNVIEMIESHKVASVMSEQIKMVFSPQEQEDNETVSAVDQEITLSELFSGYSDATWERIKQDELNEEGLDICANTGTAIWHYYWDGEAKGGNRVSWIGEMEGEVLDPINVFFGNPQQRRVQKQPYIIISSREMLDSVKSYAKANSVSKAMLAMITPDNETQDQGYDRAKKELTDGSKVTVLTKYWRKGGTVWFCKTASGVVIKPETDTGMRLYPLAVMQWKRRKKSIHGVSETEGLIPNQKAINTLVAMQILSVQLTGWPKLIYKPSAVDPSKITNSPGEMIEDRSQTGVGDGVKYLTPGNISSSAPALVEAILAYTRQMTGASDAATGNAPSADLNATAIMLLQKAAAIPIESIKRRFYRLIEDIGRIWEEFWKVKYNIPRQIQLKDDDGEEFATMFKGADYKDVQMNLKIDVGPSSTYSESLMMAGLDSALERGDITYEQYLKYIPKTVAPYKDRLMKEIEQKKGIVGTIEQIISQMQPQEQEQFASLPPEQQLMLVQQMIAPQPQGVIPPQQNMMPAAIGM